ncbi:MAG: hypothetical protein ACJ8J7_17440 [Sulfurifustaceae bacterium]
MTGGLERRPSSTGATGSTSESSVLLFENITHNHPAVDFSTALVAGLSGGNVEVTTAGGSFFRLLQKLPAWFRNIDNRSLRPLSLEKDCELVNNGEKRRNPTKSRGAQGLYGAAIDA